MMWLLAYEDADEEIFECLFKSHRVLFEYVHDNNIDQYEARYIGLAPIDTEEK